MWCCLQCGVVWYAIAASGGVETVVGVCGYDTCIVVYYCKHTRIFPHFFTFLAFFKFLFSSIIFAIFPPFPVAPHHQPLHPNPPQSSPPHTFPPIPTAL